MARRHQLSTPRGSCRDESDTHTPASGPHHRGSLCWSTSVEGLRARLLVPGTGAGEGIRTPDPLITNQMLYQLSYASRGRPLSPASTQNCSRRPGQSSKFNTTALDVQELDRQADTYPPGSPRQSLEPTACGHPHSRCIDLQKVRRKRIAIKDGLDTATPGLCNSNIILPKNWLFRYSEQPRFTGASAAKLRREACRRMPESLCIRCASVLF